MKSRFRTFYDFSNFRGETKTLKTWLNTDGPHTGGAVWRSSLLTCVASFSWCLIINIVSNPAAFPCKIMEGQRARPASDPTSLPPLLAHCKALIILTLK